MIGKELMDSFERGFRDSVAGCVCDCECGRVFFNPTGGWDWEDGELEKLEKNPNATGLDYAVETISFEGRVYVSDCDCWKKRAEIIIKFLVNHDESIAKFLTEEKKRKKAEYDRSPVVEE